MIIVGFKLTGSFEPSATLFDKEITNDKEVMPLFNLNYVGIMLLEDFGIEILPPFQTEFGRFVQGALA